MDNDWTWFEVKVPIWLAARLQAIVDAECPPETDDPDSAPASELYPEAEQGGS